MNHFPPAGESDGKMINNFISEFPRMGRPADIQALQARLADAAAGFPPSAANLHTNLRAHQEHHGSVVNADNKPDQRTVADTHEGADCQAHCGADRGADDRRPHTECTGAAADDDV